MKIRDGSLSIFWAKYVSLAAPSIFLLGAIYCEELFLKLYCFRSLTVEGVVFTFLFTLPVALMLGLLCGSVSPKRGRLLLPTGPGEPFSCPGKRFTVPQSHKTFATKKKGVPSC